MNPIIRLALQLAFLAGLVFASPAARAQNNAAGYALSFNGSNNYVSVSLASPPSNNYTLSAWVYLRTGGTFVGARAAVLGGQGCGDSVEFLIRSQTSSAADPQYLELGRCGSFDGVPSTTDVPLNAWTYVTVTCSPSQVVSYFINGNPAGTWTNASDNFSLGPTVNLGDNNGIRFFDGILAQAQIWSQTLSQSEIQSNMNHSLSGIEGGLLAYYPFGEGGGAATADRAAAAGGSTGALVNGPVWVASGIANFYSVGPEGLIEGPAAGTDSAFLSVIPASGAWTAASSASWLHLSAGNQAGTGSAKVVFTFDANLGATRTGALTIAGETFPVTQAGSTFSALSSATALVSSSLNYPSGAAVDNAGNLYIADTDNNAIKKWTAATGTLATLVASNAAHPLWNPYGVAVDPAGNVYIADTGDSAIKKWTAATGSVTTLAHTGLALPYAVALDASGNVYISDTLNNAIKKWTAANSNVTTLVPSTAPLNNPAGLAVDTAGNVYIADSSDNAVKKWSAANSSVTTVVSGLFSPDGVAVDAAGNLYIADSDNSEIKKWSAANSNLTVMAGFNGLLEPAGVAVDGAGDVYAVDTLNNRILELPLAYWDPSPKMEPPAGGADILSVVLPPLGNLQGPFAPFNDSTWLTLGSPTYGAVPMTFPAASASRTAHITVFGQTISISQLNLVEGSAAGSDSVTLPVASGVSWTAAANNAWLHLSPANQNGAGSANVIFSYDANPGATRAGTLTLAGQTVAVTQAGAAYLADTTPVILVSGTDFAGGLAVDGPGDVYFSTFESIEKWSVANNTVTTVLTPPALTPAVALDGLGNLYFYHELDKSSQNGIDKWTVANGNITTLVPGPFFSGPPDPARFSVDGRGNLYIADRTSNAVEKWTAATSNLTTLVSGLNLPDSLALDAAGNVYFADDGDGTIREWMAANSNVTTLVPQGPYTPVAVAVDLSGNVYATASLTNAFLEWSAASNAVTTLISADAHSIYASGVGVDAAGDLYFVDGSSDALKELPRAFADPTPKLEPAAAGNDVLPPVVPAAANLLPPFAPASDQSWLTITGSTNGVVSFAFDYNTNTSTRTANITLLGQTIPVTQSGIVITPPILTGFAWLYGEAVQFFFTNSFGPTFTVHTTTNLSLPVSQWTTLGHPSYLGAGVYQYTALLSGSNAQQFYSVTSP